MFENLSIELPDEQKYVRLAECINNASAKRDFLYPHSHPTGGHYYRLLAHISSRLPDDSIVFDVGTYRGISALALSYNEKVKVVSWDIANFNAVTNPGNITFNIGNFLDDDQLLDSKLMFIDVDPHDGIQEAAFLTQLIKLDYRGILIFDDIHLNEGMQTFWDSTLPYTRRDLTSLGHATGTGIVILKDEYHDEDFQRWVDHHQLYELDEEKNTCD